MQALRVCRTAQLALVRHRRCFTTSTLLPPALLQHVPLDRLALQGKLQVQISDRTHTNVEIVPVLAASEFALKAFGASSRTSADVFDVTQEAKAGSSDSSSNAIASVRIAKRSSSDDSSASEPTTLQLFVPHLVDLNVSVARGDVHIRDKIEGDVRVTVGDGAINVHKLRGKAISLKTNRGAIAIASLLEGEHVTLAASAVTCKRVMAGAADVKLHKSSDSSDFGAIYASACVVTSQATGSLTVGSAHGYLRIVGDEMAHVAVHSVNGALDLEDSGRTCNALVHFDSWTLGARSSIVVGGDVAVSVEPTAPLAVELHGRAIATDGCAFSTHEHEQLDDDYAIVSGTLAPLASSTRASGSSGKINVGRAKSDAMSTSFFMGADDSSSASASADDAAALDARLLVHATGGSVQLEQLDWMAKLKRKHLTQ